MCVGPRHSRHLLAAIEESRGVGKWLAGILDAAASIGAMPPYLISCEPAEASATIRPQGGGGGAREVAFVRDE